MDIQPAFPVEPGFIFPSRIQILEKFAILRQEWEEAANGQSLVDVESSVGLILADFAVKLDLTTQEKYVVLGKGLIKDLAAIIEAKSAH